MAVIFKFLMSLVAHVLWQRAGGKGPVPPVRLPRGKAPVNLPVIAPWQMMLLMWVLDKIWKQHGARVKAGLRDHTHPLAQRVGSLLPDAATPDPASTLNAPVSSTPAPVVNSHDTQKLPSSPSSLLSSLQSSGASS